MRLIIGLYPPSPLLQRPTGFVWFCFLNKVSNLQNFAHPVLVPHEQPGSANILPVQRFPDSFAGNDRIIVDLGKVGQENPFEPFVDDFVEQFRGIIIGEMTVARFYPLLKMPGIGAVYKHLLIMVGFQHQHSATFQLLLYKPGGDTEVGRNSDPGLVEFQEKPHGIARIMSYRKRVNQHIPVCKRTTGFKFDNLVFSE